MPENPPFLYIDLDGVIFKRRHSGMFDAFELASRRFPNCEYDSVANTRGFAMPAAVRVRRDYEAAQLRELAKRSDDE